MIITLSFLLSCIFDPNWQLIIYSIWDIAANDAKKAEIAAKKEADGMCAVSGFYDAFSVWYRLCHVLYSYLYYILSITAKAAAEKREQAAKAAAEKKEADG